MRRVNRALASTGCKIRKCHSLTDRQRFGDYVVVDEKGEPLYVPGPSLEGMARKLDVLRPWEIVGPPPRRKKKK